MKQMDANPKDFAILSTLLQRPRTPAEIRERLNWSTSQNDFRLRQEWLIERGLIGKRPCRHKGRKAVCLEITEAGKAYWREAADFYLSTITLAESDSPAGPDEYLPADPPRARSGPCKATKRLPTQQETWKLHSTAESVEELLTWDVLRAAPRLSISKLFALEIGDVDLPGRVLTIRREGRRPQKVKADAPLIAALRTAIGDRQAGPVLQQANGEPWYPDRWGIVWRRWKRRADIGSEVVCRWRPTCGGKMPACRTSDEELNRAG